MLHRPKTRLAVLAALALAAAMPTAATQAAAPAQPSVADTPLYTNLVRNHSFGSGPESDPIPYWTVKGDVFLEKFGTHAFPSVAYGKKYNGGKHYLTCGKTSGYVRQTVPYSGPIMGTHNNRLRKAKLQVDFGGVKGNLIKVQVRALNDSDQVIATHSNTKTLDISYHYKQAVATLPLPPGTAKLEATIELLPKPGASCQMDADTAIFQVMVNS